MVCVSLNEVWAVVGCVVKKESGGESFNCAFETHQWQNVTHTSDPASHFWYTFWLMFHAVKGYVNPHIWSCIPRVQHSRNFQRSLMVRPSATQVGCRVRSMVKSNTPGFGLIFDNLWCDDSCSESAMQRERELITDDDNHDRNFKKNSWGAREL